MVEFALRLEQGFDGLKLKDHPPQPPKQNQAVSFMPPFPK